MALNKLYYVYGLDTACFYTDEEQELEKKIILARHLKAGLKDNHTKYFEDMPKFKDNNSYLTQYINNNKEKLKNMLAMNNGLTRTVRPEKLTDKRKVSIFDSNLTRCFGLKEREINDEIIIVKVYFFDVAESIVKNGFYMNGNKYVFFSSSAGQIRTKKLVAVREDLLLQNWNTLTAGLTLDRINSCGGMNINKYLAYLALCNSATDLWEDFNIDDCIVVDDFETMVHSEVDFIDDKTYEIQRKQMDIPITHTDGAGMILPCLSKKNFMVRLPWVKGLLGSFDFHKFISEYHCNAVLTDIYGDKHDIIAENIKIIFTKSQFKMWKFFRNWNEYKDNFKQYHCSAAKCNVEEDIFPNATINYQMIQTLSDMTDAEIKLLAQDCNKDLSNLASDSSTMLKVFGATSWNTNKSGFQKCLEIYPELLSDRYSRQTLRDIKTSLEQDLWSAKFKLNSKYTFVLPDMFAFCEYLFLGIENPQGLLKNGEVCCKLFDNGKKLDCLRSPHLYREHPIKLNKTNIEWFDTNGIYTSIYDTISKVLQFDVDGDKLLVTDNATLVKCAERSMDGIVPLFYNMSKASAETLSPETLFKGLMLAYTGGNIGEPSNDITKCWNSGKITQEQLNVIKWLVMEVNFTIDYAKTLYKPERPEFANAIINKYIKSKTPQFFLYAKNKKETQVENKSACVVDRIKDLFPSKKMNFTFPATKFGKFDYRVLMNNPDIIYDKSVAKHFQKITSNLAFSKVDDKKLHNYLAIYESARSEIVEDKNINDVVDILVLDLFHIRNSAKKKAFWTLFGEEIYQNICKNLNDSFVLCERCHKRFHKERKNQKFCAKCRGYVKQKIRTVICCDCGEEFKTDARTVIKIRCTKCQKEHIKEYDRIRKRKNP